MVTTTMQRTNFLLSGPSVFCCIQDENYVLIVILKVKTCCLFFFYWYHRVHMCSEKEKGTPKPFKIQDYVDEVFR
jgi:hypothetical protein